MLNENVIKLFWRLIKDPETERMNWRRREFEDKLSITFQKPLSMRWHKWTGKKKISIFWSLIWNLKAFKVVFLDNTLHRRALTSKRQTDGQTDRKINVLALPIVSPCRQSPFSLFPVASFHSPSLNYNVIQSTADNKKFSFFLFRVRSFVRSMVLRVRERGSVIWVELRSQSRVAECDPPRVTISTLRQGVDFFFFFLSYFFTSKFWGMRSWTLQIGDKWKILFSQLFKSQNINFTLLYGNLHNKWQH